MDQPKLDCHRRRASAGSQKLLQADCDLGGVKSYHDCLMEVIFMLSRTAKVSKTMISVS